ncbi:MAG: methyl-accepting chemotaxis protein [Cyanobacteria bacterium P01_F01_bin.86]
MLTKIIRNPANSVVGQLRLIVAVLFVFAAFNLANLYRQTIGAGSDSRVVNYTGIVRGKTQKLVKLVFLQGQSDAVVAIAQEDTDTQGNPDNSVPELEPEGVNTSPTSIEETLPREEIQAKIDATIPELDQIIAGLTNGDRDLDLVKVRNSDFQTNMAELSKAWEQLKADLESFLNDPTPQKQLDLLAASEAYWDVTNKTTFAAEANAANNLRNFIWLTMIGNVSILAIILVISEKLRAKLRNTVASLTSSSTQIATTLTQQERIASRQAASVNETTTTMDELEASSRNAAEQANAAVEDAKKAFAASEAGQQAVTKGLEGMFTLENKVEAIAEQIVTLGDQADQISNISQLVIDFANQTNMLALNSSVEAVRAGEHGKGFAVVANEIRKLADQSQQSADKINTLVSEIQKAMNETVMVAEEGTKTVKSGVQIARQAEQAFGDVKQAVNQVVLNNQQVSLNLKQQVDAIQQVVDAMEAINQGARETAGGLGQTKAGTQHLHEAAIGLQKMV